MAGERRRPAKAKYQTKDPTTYPPARRRAHGSLRHHLVPLRAPCALTHLWRYASATRGGWRGGCERAGISRPPVLPRRRYALRYRPDENFRRQTVRSLHVDRVVPLQSAYDRRGDGEGDRVRTAVIRARLVENQRAVRLLRIACGTPIVLRKVGESLAVLDGKRTVLRLFEDTHHRLAGRRAIRRKII